jgi:hypothetical protein
MTILFKDELHEDFGTWPLGYTPYGGADFGEVKAVAEAVGNGDDGAYYAVWNEAADRMVQEAAATLAKGHVGSAREMMSRSIINRRVLDWLDEQFGQRSGEAGR